MLLSVLKNYDMRLLLLSFFLTIQLVSFSQEQSNTNPSYNIDITVDKYDQDFVVIGYYYGDRQLVLDTLLRNEDGKFILSGEEPLNKGTYILLLSPNNRYIQFLVDEHEQNFSIQLDTADLGNPVMNGSKDNQVFLDYISFINSKGQENEKIISEINVLKEKGEDYTELTQKQAELDKEVKAYQANIFATYPNSVTTHMIKTTMDVEIPEFEEEGEALKEKQYFYYKEHFFDHIDLGDSVFLRTPFFHNKIMTYVEKLTPQSPDSVAVAIDYILKQMEPANETYKFYLSHFLNTYARAKIVGFDAVYVHLVDNYYAKGKADWVDEETLRKIVAEAEKIRPTLIGKKAQEIQVYRKDKTPITLEDIESKYLILYFWAPDCGHCKKATPHVIDFYKKYKDTLNVDVEILAVCTKHKDKEPSCWEAVEEKGMDLWINASDVDHLSQFKIKYNVQSTPSIFILNEDREIVMKRIGAEYLDEVMQEIIRVDDLKAMEEQMEKKKG